jgi:1-acyl-sn-glycerol-3-phosphate acyltransferase
MVEVSAQNQSPKSGNAFSKWLGRTGLAMMRWEVTGGFPDCKKYIVVLAPHSSNWDFMVGIFTLLASGIKMSFLIKHSLFFWPFSLFLRKVGGIPTNRKGSHGVVEQTIGHFNSEERLVVALAPEGTRRAVSQWKKGFLYMAHGAKVPVLPVALDYQHKQLKIGTPITVTGVVEDDLQTIKAFYKGIQGKNAQVS